MSGTLSTSREIAAGVVMAVLVLAGCGGSGPDQVQITADWEAGTFTAGGDAAICAAGEHIEAAFADDGEWVDYELVCVDGSGTLVLRAVFEPLTEAQEAGEDLIDQFVGTWSVTDGTGDYSSAEGGGELVVEFTDGALATYDGELSL